MSLTHHAILALLFFAVGCCVGSFINVCVFRTPRRLSLIRPGSRCPRCHAAIEARDNVPILGWLLLRGMCRACSCPISARYPLVELGTGLAFAGTYAAAVGAVSGDLWEMTGAATVLFRLLLAWAAVSVAVVVALSLHDARTESIRGARVGRQEQNLSGSEGASLAESIAVQFSDLAGPPGVVQPVAGNTPESLKGSHDVDR
jgi:hypothetical protein